jgi:hypothetical protein
VFSEIRCRCLYYTLFAGPLAYMESIPYGPLFWPAAGKAEPGRE